MTLQEAIEKARVLGFDGPKDEFLRDLEDIAAGRASYKSRELPGCKSVGLIEVGKSLAEFGLPPGVDPASLDLTRVIIEEPAPAPAKTKAKGGRR